MTKLWDPDRNVPFSRGDATIGFAAARICWLLVDLLKLGIEPNSSDQINLQVGEAKRRLKTARQLENTLLTLQNLLANPDCLSRWEWFSENTTEPIAVSSIDSYCEFAGVDFERLLAETQWRRDLKHNKAGSALERFIRDDLWACYRELFCDSRRATRLADQTLDGPFVRFAGQFFKEIRFVVSDETIVKALSSASANRKSKDKRKSKRETTSARTR